MKANFYCNLETIALDRIMEYPFGSWAAGIDIALHFLLLTEHQSDTCFTSLGMRQWYRSLKR